jgi:hypothetical protein
MTPRRSRKARNGPFQKIDETRRASRMATGCHKETTMQTRVLLIAAAALGLGACGDDDLDLPGDDDVEPIPRSFMVRIENVAPWTVLKAGIATTKTNGMQGPAGPGEAFELQFTARRGHYLSFASMLGESNDWFFAPNARGIPLFNARDRPRSGDVTRYVELWNAGTEIDQEPGVGDATGPRQPSPDFGAADPVGRVRVVPSEIRLDNGTMFTRPETSAMIRVTLRPGPDELFTVRVENVSTATTLQTSEGPMPVHLSPFAWTVHSLPGPIFEDMAVPRDNGLEELAESGDPGPLGATLAASAGFHTSLSPGVFVVHELGENPLFEVGEPDFGAGLEALAEDGQYVPLRDELARALPEDALVRGAFDTPVGATTPAPLRPGQAYEFTVRGFPGDAVSFATMFAMSNDWFFGPVDGIALFDGITPRSGDVTSEVFLLDVGTELDEEIAIGPNTAPQQPAPNRGPLDPVRAVREVTADRYAVPKEAHLRVTLTPF